MADRVFHQLIMGGKFACPRTLPVAGGAERFLFPAAGQQAVQDIEKNRVNKELKHRIAP